MSYLDGFLNKQQEKSDKTTSAEKEALNADSSQESGGETPVELAASDVFDVSAPVTAKGSPLEADQKKALQSAIIDALCEIYDPEIPVDIYQMGLIYDVVVGDYADIEVVMTLTTPHCPVAESMPGEVEMKVQDVAGVGSARVELVWEPPWDISMMSEAARLEMGFM